MKIFCGLPTDLNETNRHNQIISHANMTLRMLMFRKYNHYKPKYP